MKVWWVGASSLCPSCKHSGSQAGSLLCLLCEQGFHACFKTRGGPRHMLRPCSQLCSRVLKLPHVHMLALGFAFELPNLAELYRSYHLRFSISHMFVESSLIVYSYVERAKRKNSGSLHSPGSLCSAVMFSYVLCHHNPLCPPASISEQ